MASKYATGPSQPGGGAATHVSLQGPLAGASDAESGVAVSTPPSSRSRASSKPSNDAHAGKATTNPRIAAIPNAPHFVEPTKCKNDSAGVRR